MRARFVTSIAGADFDFAAGTEVSVAGTTFGVDTVPEEFGRAWLASGVLVSVPAVPASAAMQSPETAAFAAAKPRQMAGRR
jgi:hypothetical protein